MPLDSFPLPGFVKGVDVRRPAFAAPIDTLQIAEDMVLSRDGSLEVRKDFVDTYDVSAQTFGLREIGDALYVFGYLAAAAVYPPLPTGINYQQLVSSDTHYPVAVLSSDLYDGKVYAAAQMDDGTRRHYYDGVEVSDWFDGRARAQFDVLTGGGNIATVKANGVEILNVAVTWATSNSATAAAVAAQINAYGSVPEYTAVSLGATVVVLAAAADGVTPNGYTLAVTVTATATVSTPTAFANGVAPTTTPTPGAFVTTHQQKVYSVSGPLLLFSSIDGPLYWNSDADGAGTIDLSTYASGSEELVAGATYFDSFAVFSHKKIQIWNTFADPASNKLAQTIPNSGTDSPRSIHAFRDTDLLYLDRYRGPAALQPASIYNQHANLDMVGAPLFPPDNSPAAATLSGNLRAFLDTLTEDEKAAAVAIVEPGDSRYWLTIADRVYVLNFFREEQIQGWTVFLPGLSFTDFAIVSGRLYARAGNKIYLYGGTDGDSYPAENVGRVRLPSLRMGAPQTLKDFVRLDVGAEGAWSARMYASKRDTDGRVVANFVDDTYDNTNGIPLAKSGNNPVLEFVRTGTGFARLINFDVQFSTRA